ncbi:PilM protein [Roseateles sp. YR242]|uniref:type IV pilus biogenesis protein PilM n=1 Tax=Roseateles sp. YR242 TaxID=1855305 RepID=UPI0008C1FC57|nr:type IV pilus biogenesis protein PilM [Roseateles sp. YR242]SEK64451.1 PilM protein [Roseateles sp. YR242]
MWAQAMLVSAAAAIGWMALDARHDAREVEGLRSRSTAESMATVRSAAVAFSRAHPSFEGALAQGDLGLPDWAHPSPGIHARIDGRLVIVYLDGVAPPDLLMQMRRLAGGSMLVGQAHAATGTLMSPDLGDTGIAVSADIPDGAAVWLAARE